MRRFIDSALKEWKDHPRRKPLILRGARQVGKTYSLEQFGEKHFSNTAIIDLERNPDWHRIFSGDIQAKNICAELEVLLNKKIISGKTLLFIDEIQACPRAVMALRYFFEEMPDLHVVAAGSLLEFALGDISFPVGRIQFLNLHPLSFAEYLEATGREEAAQIVLGPPKALSQTVHEYLCEELRRYFFIGGMPECVKSYVDSGSVQEAFHVQAEICTTYRMDFSKYAPHSDKHCLNAVLTSVAQRVGQQIKYARLAEDYTNPTLKKAFNLLSLANVIRRVPSADPSGLPLGATASGKIFKAIVVDIGLMQHLAGMPSDLEYQKADLMNMYQGALAEQFVGQEMVLSQQGDLYYWSRRAKSSTAEVDFLAVKNGNIFPIEVKSGPSGRLRSMHLCLERYPNCPGGIVFSSRPYSELPKEKLTFIPLYFACSATGGIRIS
jgi:predicted AAA+ superfamily ATPase